MSLNELDKLRTVKVIRNEQFLWYAGRVLERARKDVILCSYKFELSRRTDALGLNSLLDILYTVAINKIQIRVLLNVTGLRSSLSKININTARTLVKKGIEVRALKENRCQHAKILIVDGRLGIIGSHNWTPRSLTENFEASVVLSGADVLEDIVAHFEKIWLKSIDIGK